MDNRQFIEDYKEAFGEKAALPIAFWHSFIGLFDPSVRPRVRANELMFGIPKSRLEEMASLIRDTCLFNGAAWPKVKERIKDGSPSAASYY